MVKYLYIFVVVLVLFSCSEMPTRDNPHDTNFDMPEPENLEVEHISLTTKKITWDYELENFDGFIISRKVNNTWQELDTVSCDARDYLDETVPVNEHIQYKITAFAGENSSEDVVTDEIFGFPAPYDLNVTIEDEGIILSWEYYLEGIEGFRIEKKAVGEDWQLYADNINADTRAWTDNNSIYLDSFRIKAFYEGYESAISNEVIYEIEGIIFVEGGTYEMGDHFNEGDSDEMPVHNVTISSFYIGQHEVTQAEYESVMGDNPAHDYGVGDDYPVYYVDWYDAVEYCNALSIQSGLTPCYDTSDWSCDFSANGYRLPTEAEWEYAARGGVNWEDNYRYSGTTDELGEYAVYSANDPGHAEEVESKLPNQLGLYDMSGNVWEWCYDWYDENYYETSPEVDPEGPSSTSSRVNRGGSWYSDARSCRSANRNRYTPVNSYNIIGFRLARSSY